MTNQVSTVVSNQPKTFQFYNHAVRVIEENGKVLFCGKDVAEALGYAKPQNAIASHCKGALKRGTPTDGGWQEMLYIPEGDVYRLIARSQLESVQEFESWLFDEVVPSVVNTGGYGQISPEMEMARGLLAAQQLIEQKDTKILQLENKIEADRSKTIFADAVSVSDDCIKVGTLAKFMEENGVKNIGQNRLFAWLRDNGYLMKDGRDNVPTQRATEMKLFKMKTRIFIDPDDEANVRTRITTYVTGKGQQYFLNKFLAMERQAA